MAPLRDSGGWVRGSLTPHPRRGASAPFRILRLGAAQDPVAEDDVADREAAVPEEDALVS